MCELITISRDRGARGSPQLKMNGCGETSQVRYQLSGEDVPTVSYFKRGRSVSLTMQAASHPYSMVCGGVENGPGDPLSSSCRESLVLSPRLAFGSKQIPEMAFSWEHLPWNILTKLQRDGNIPTHSLQLKLAIFLFIITTLEIQTM